MTEAESEIAKVSVAMPVKRRPAGDCVFLQQRFGMLRYHGFIRLPRACIALTARIPCAFSPVRDTGDCRAWEDQQKQKRLMNEQEQNDVCIVVVFNLCDWCVGTVVLSNAHQ
jgi:hypothetical protein